MLNKNILSISKELLKALITVLLIYLCLRKISVLEIKALIGQANGAYLGLAFLMQILGLFIASFKWSYIGKLVSLNIPFPALLKATFLYSWINNSLPSTFFGEIFRYQAIKNLGSKKKIIYSQFLDKISQYLLTIHILVLSLILNSENYIKIFNYYEIKITKLQILGGGVFFLVLEVAFFYIFKKYYNPKWVLNLKSKFLEFRSFLAHQIIALAFFGALLLSFYFCNLALSIELHFTLFTAVFPLAIICLLFPITISGWGLRELSFATFYAPFLENSGEIIASSLCFGLLSLFSSLPGLIVLWNKRRDHKPNQLNTSK